MKTGDHTEKAAKKSHEILATSGRNLTKDLIASIRKRLADPAQRRHEFTKPKEFRDKLTQGLVLRVEPGGTLTWFVEYRCVGEKKRGKDIGETVKRTSRYKLGRDPALTLDMARRRADEVRLKIDKGNDVASDPNYRDRRGLSDAQKVPSLGTFIGTDYRMARYAKAQEKADGDSYDLERLKGRADADIARVKKLFANFLSYQLDTITKPDIERWRINRLNDEKRKATVNRDVAILRGVLTKAVDLDVIEFNRLHGLKDYRLSNEVEKRLAGDEYDRLISAIDMHEQWRRWNTSISLPDWMKAGHYDEAAKRDLFDPPADYLKVMVLLSLWTGVRRGDLVHLRWAEVELDHKPKPRLYLRASATKSIKRHHVRLSSNAARLLQVWRDQHEKSEVKAQNFVFTSRAGTPLDGDNVGRAWRRVIKVAGLDDFRWHDMRHDYTSRAVSKKKSLFHVQELIGHSDPRMTQRYAHLIEDELDSTAEELDER